MNMLWQSTAALEYLQIHFNNLDPMVRVVEGNIFRLLETCFVAANNASQRKLANFLFHIQKF